jgi:hypothetical protein
MEEHTVAVVGRGYEWQKDGDDELTIGAYLIVLDDEDVAETLAKNMEEELTAPDPKSSLELVAIELDVDVPDDLGWISYYETVTNPDEAFQLSASYLIVCQGSFVFFAFGFGDAGEDGEAFVPIVEEFLERGLTGDYESAEDALDLLPDENDLPAEYNVTGDETYFPTATAGSAFIGQPSVGIARTSYSASP